MPYAWLADTWDVLRQVRLGDLGTWVGGLATASGLWFAGIQIKDSREERKAEEKRRRAEELERREALARAVAISSIARCDDDGWTISYTLLNGGDYPIGSVVVVGESLHPECMPKYQQFTSFQNVVGTMHQGQLVEDEVKVKFKYREPVFGELTNLVSVIFTDTWGQSWYRKSGSVERLGQQARIC